MIQVIDEVFMTQAPDIFGAAEFQEPAPMRTNTKHRPPRILLAEDDVEMRRYLAEAFRSANFEVVEAEDGTRVLDYIATRAIGCKGLDVDLVVSDIRMPGANGLHLLSTLRSHRHDLPVVRITAFGNPEPHEEARLRGALAVIDKPFDFDELLAVVRGALAPDGQANLEQRTELAP